jgi:hypothetical protein
MEMKINAKYLRKLYIIQVRVNPNTIFSVYDPIQSRFNPWNPLSYVAIAILSLIKLSFDIVNSIKGCIKSGYFKWF